MTDTDILHSYFAAWNARDADAILACFDEGGTYEDPGTDGPLSGEALRGYVSGLWAAFPDLHFIERSMGRTGPDAAAAEWLMRGTNTGSFMGLPPTGKPVEIAGADFFTLRNGKLASVTGYFDKGVLPRQIGLDIVVQPSQIGPFRFGVSTMVQTGKTDEPAAFSITYLEARDDAAVEVVRNGSRDSLIDMLGMEGFIGATTAKIGTRMVTISAWDSPEAPRQVMTKGAHAEAQKGFFDGSVAQRGFTSVWVKERVNPYWERCDACGKMARDPGPDRVCKCGASLPPAQPFW